MATQGYDPPRDQVRAIRQAADELHATLCRFIELRGLESFPQDEGALGNLEAMFALDAALNPARLDWGDPARRRPAVNAWQSRTRLGLRWLRDWLDRAMLANEAASFSGRRSFGDWLDAQAAPRESFTIEGEGVAVLRQAIDQLAAELDLPLPDDPGPDQAPPPIRAEPEPLPPEAEPGTPSGLGDLQALRLGILSKALIAPPSPSIPSSEAPPFPERFARPRPERPSKPLYGPGDPCLVLLPVGGKTYPYVCGEQANPVNQSTEDVLQTMLAAEPPGLNNEELAERSKVKGARNCLAKLLTEGTERNKALWARVIHRAGVKGGRNRIYDAEMVHQADPKMVHRDAQSAPKSA